ncbi:alpha/beta hydrolase [Pseudomonas gingeri NCPPB 3146 = LMG 5327]|uniref:Alpha/beta fold hydrolase n=3 Tax=Pseudomonas gingeri TaxID=117681 RepID=A0A7Y8CAN6_9PSED|nr:MULTISPECIES: alpha/beta fold hydrolase [Pseudomonas]NVZ28400.1 alpha/beta fold hydrolase [Pseudomonas gingeri]NVZ62104.1 alpha/beta fold hydrolase [Pseudomonas gingeri]NWA09096.1 alpha/beta fold hydrolase [Pseudomonas gingeri]NWC12355.1 alpha/beta fold hydrolase [Pseudomonas gingeri]NWE48853.1 alpha/beta fold hydrolase [Pseudomonas gingeri]
MSTLSWIRGINGTLGRVAPRVVASRMRQMFMTPRARLPRDWELPLLATAERITLRFGLSALRWGKGPTVLLMHGWEGRPTQFANLINALVAAGYTAVALDGPAHGRSPGREANVVVFARALLEAAAELPPLKAVVGHSMGGASAMLATQLGLRTEALVSIAAPARVLGVLRGFARYVGLPPRARSAFIREVERDVGMRAAHLDIEHYQMDMPGLIVHAEDDRMVRVDESRRIHEAWFDSRLLRLESGGHLQVLADQRLIDGVLALLAGRSLAQRQSA